MEKRRNGPFSNTSTLGADTCAPVAGKETQSEPNAMRSARRSRDRQHMNERAKRGVFIFCSVHSLREIAGRERTFEARKVADAAGQSFALAAATSARAVFK